MFQKIFSRKILLLSAMTTGVLIALISYEHFGSDNIAECRLKKTYDLQIKCFTDLANTGNADAQYTLGEIYQDGLGVPQNRVLASEYWQKSIDSYQKLAEQGDVKAQYRLGELYYLGKGAPVNNSKAQEWLEKAANQGSEDAQSLLGILYTKEGNYTKATEYFQKATTHGNSETFYKIATLYEDIFAHRFQRSYDHISSYEDILKHNEITYHPGTYRDDFQNNDALGYAIYWWGKASDLKNATASLKLAIAYEYGGGVQKNLSTAAEYYQKAALQGNADAQERLGLLYQTGQAVPQDNAQAARWFQKAANQNNVEAQDHLGLLYYIGQGVPKDNAQAAQWFRKAADQNNAEAQDHLGLLYYAGQGVPKDNDQARKYFQKAADQKNADALFHLGELYHFGDGVPQDDDKAQKYFREAADNHANSDMLYRIASYTYDDEQKKHYLGNYWQTQSYFEQAAQHADTSMLYKIASFYEKIFVTNFNNSHSTNYNSYEEILENYNNVSEDLRNNRLLDAAVNWWKKASLQKNTEASMKLALSYEDGFGVQKNLSKAAEYYQKACDNGEQKGCENYARLHKDGN